MSTTSPLRERDDPRLLTSQLLDAEDERQRAAGPSAPVQPPAVDLPAAPREAVALVGACVLASAAGAAGADRLVLAVLLLAASGAAVLTSLRDGAAPSAAYERLRRLPTLARLLPAIVGTAVLVVGAPLLRSGGEAALAAAAAAVGGAVGLRVTLRRGWTMPAAAGALEVLGFALPAMPGAVVTAVGVGFAAAWLPTAAATVVAVASPQLRRFSVGVAAAHLTGGALLGGLLTAALANAWDTRTALLVVVPLVAAGTAALIDQVRRSTFQDVTSATTPAARRNSSSSSLLQVRGIDFAYGPVQVLFDVDLDVAEGEVVALLGTNGAGKSTLLRVISGLAVPARGEVTFAGDDLTYSDPTARVRRGIVQVPGGKAVFPTLTVAENLQAGAYSYVWDRQRLRARIEHVVERFPRLAERFDQPAGTLSGGEQQMLAIAKALLLEPRVLLIDELSLGLAPVVVQELLAVVEQLAREGMTIVVVEQSVNVALSIASRAIFMEKGAVRFEGAARDLLERDDLLRAVFLGGAGG